MPASPTKAPELNDQRRLQILEHLIAGKTIVETAELVGLHRSKVETAASMYGHPRVARMEWSRDLLREALRGPAPVDAPAIATPTPAAPPPAAPDPGAAQRAAAARRAADAGLTPPGPIGASPLKPPAPTPPAAPAREEQLEAPPAPRQRFALDALDALDALVAQGRASDVARTRDVAEQLIETAAVLLYRLGHERPHAPEPLAAEPRAAAVRADPPVQPEPTIGSRAGSAAAARARGVHQRVVLARHGVTSADVREWAAGRGIACSRGPMLPRAVLDLFEASHQEAS